MNIAKILTPRAGTALLHANDSVRKGMEIMEHHGYTAIPVLDTDEKYIGSVTEGDFLRYVMAAGSTDLHDMENSNIRQILRQEFCKPLGIMADEQQVIQSVLQQNYVPIVDDRGCLCGIVTRKSVIKYLSEKSCDYSAERGLDDI